MSALVLVHAFPLDHRMYDRIRPAVEAAGWQLFTPDLRGFGIAPEFEHPPNLDQSADDIVELLNQHGIERAVVGGTSVGGYVTMAMLRRAPERLAGLILIDTKASADSAEARANRLRIADQVAASDSTEAFGRSLLPNLLSSHTQQEHPEIVAQVREIIGAARPRGVADLQRAMAIRPDSHADLKACRIPVMSLRGSEDVVATAEDHAGMIAVLADAVHFEVQGAGHLPPIEAPGATATAIVEFLRKVSAVSC